MQTSSIVKNRLKAALGLLLGLLVLLPTLALQAQAPNPGSPVPTLVPPTLVATVTPMPAQAVDYSGVLTMQEEGVMRVGARYNRPPFSYFSEFGSVDGYEAAIVRALANELGVEVEWVQVTGENEEDLLRTGEVDLLIGEQPVTRDALQHFEFTHPYYLNQQRMVVLTDSPHNDFAGLSGQPVAVVFGSRGELASQNLVAAGHSLELRQYLTEEEALDALQNGEVQAMVGQYNTLIQAGRQGMRFIEQPVELTPYAIRLRHYDVNLRNILNRSLQRLYASGGLTGIYESSFAGQELDFDALIPKYDAMYVDERSLEDLNWDVPRPQNSVLERIRAGETLTVVGLSLDPAADFYERQLDSFHQGLVEEMARRWGVQVEFLPNSYRTKLDMLFSGSAMMAAGVTPIWDPADRFDYSQAYMMHANKLMRLERSRILGFGDLRGGTDVGYWYEDGGTDGTTSWGARHEIERISDALRVLPTVREFRSYADIQTEFANRTVDAIFGDTLRLRAIMQSLESSGLPFEILPDTYSLSPISFAVPRNDVAFRNLVNFTLQDMYLDGTYQRLYEERVGFDEPTLILPFPGDGSYLLSP